ncbi:DUF2141 domain-containing protein [Spirosoma sp. KCTC 42546]|uniref:DUF2141 domain-containing protein n=1 Tax=Spirosoma sp. KCTC 42546 TaxID=2520506 RepID=UPI00115702EE|nr:DUF2141 domain-containing protein [Spirosoma sp. KCTC 42546]QDK82349.1 DUF2141 domain-containing protein [Spirosoma sp. KCTC 42546]
MKTILIAIVSLALWATPAYTQGALTVNVTGFKNEKGQCTIWLFNSADGFPSNHKKALRYVEAPINGLSSLVVFNQLPTGHYALAVVYDQNGNHQLNYNLFHIPKEAYGISNDACGGLDGPPTFEQDVDSDCSSDQLGSVAG